MIERRFYTRSATALIATLVTLGGLIGCADTASVVRKFTYPPDFKYISQGDLRSGMATLALHLERLDNALAPNDPAQTVDQAEVRQILADRAYKDLCSLPSKYVLLPKMRRISRSVILSRE